MSDSGVKTHLDTHMVTETVLPQIFGPLYRYQSVVYSMRDQHGNSVRIGDRIPIRNPTANLTHCTHFTASKPESNAQIPTQRLSERNTGLPFVQESDSAPDETK
jgi:hypothetical protein